MPRSQSTYKAQQYWVYEAHQHPEARALAAQLNLAFPQGRVGCPEGNFTYPIRRLVATGKDTPSNMRLLFGTSTVADTAAYREARRRALLVEHEHSGGGGSDDNWAPRPASAREAEELRGLLRVEDKYKETLPFVLGGLRDRPGRKTSIASVSDEGYGRMSTSP